MRPGPNSRRLRGRGGGGRRGGPGRPQNFESSGPDIKVRGSAQQVVEKYLALAREAATAGNPVMAENYYQHAEHYYRIQNANNSNNAGNSGGNGREQPAYQPDGPNYGANGAAEDFGDSFDEPPAADTPQPDLEPAPEPEAAEAPQAEADAAPEERPAPRRRRPRSRDAGSVKEPVEQPS